MSSSGVKTVIRTELCGFSEFRIYPGRGTKFVARDGKTHLFFNNKCRSMFLRRRKPARLRWTLSWRRAHKKLRTSDLVQKRKTRRAAKVQKAIVGLSLDDMKSVRAKIKEDTAKAKEAKEQKLQQQEQKKKKVVAPAAARKTGPKQREQKVQKVAMAGKKDYKK